MKCVFFIEEALWEMENNDELMYKVLICII